MRIEQRKSGFVILCGCCNDPFARVQEGRLVITSRHKSQAHTNGLSLEELKNLVEVIERQNSSCIEQEFVIKVV